MTESNYLRRCLLTLSRFATVFRHNVGEAWQGPTHASGPGWVRISHPQRVRYGLCVGGSDIIGWVPMTIRPEHVGQQVAVFLAVEVKAARTQATDQQIQFLQAVADAGGIAVLTREGDGRDLGAVLTEAKEGETIGGRIHGTLPSPRRSRSKQSLN